jgi:hypothetical protein
MEFASHEHQKDVAAGTDKQVNKMHILYDFGSNVCQSARAIKAATCQYRQKIISQGVKKNDLARPSQSFFFC